MSQIKINKIAAKTTNQNLTVAPDGTGVLEVSGDNDAAIHLKDSQNLNGVKIQAPPSSAAQDYTLILPDTDLVQDRYLQVDSITGSGSTAVGQLRSATIAPPDLTNLNASNLTSGTVPDARYSVTGSTGGGLKLIQKQTITSGSLTSISFTSLDANAQYLLIGNDVHLSSNNYIYISLQNSSGSNLGAIDYEVWQSSTMNATSRTNRSAIELDISDNRDRYCFFMDFCTGNPNTSTQQSQLAWFRCRTMDRAEREKRSDIWGSFDHNSAESSSTGRIHGITVYSGANLEYDTEISLYKYQET